MAILMKIKGFLIALWGVKTPLIISLITLCGLNGRPAYSLPNDIGQWLDKKADKAEASQSQNQNQQNQQNNSSDPVSNASSIPSIPGFGKIDFKKDLISFTSCELVYNTLSTVTTCPQTGVCIFFHAILTTSSQGNESICNLSATSDFTKQFASFGDLVLTLEDGVSVIAPDAVVSVGPGETHIEYLDEDKLLNETKQLKFSYDNSNAMAVPHYIRFTGFTVDGQEKTVADAGQPGNGNPGGNNVNGGAANVPGISNPFGNPLGGVNLQPAPGGDGSCDETVDGGVMDVSCAPSDNPPTDDPTDPDDPADPGASAGGSASGVDPLGTPTLMIQGASCQMNPYASINFGFGWLALLGLMISSLSYRRFK